MAEHFAQNHEVAVFTRTLASRKKNRLGKISIFGYEPLSPPSFLKKIRSFAPDVVIVYGDVFDFLQYAIDEFPEKVVFFTGGAGRILSKSSMRWFIENRLKTIRLFVCHTVLQKDYNFLREIDVLDHTKILPCGIDLEEFDNNSLTRKDILKEHTVPSEIPWILNVSNFFPGKGQEFLIEILDRTNLKDFLYLQVCSTTPFKIGEQLEMRWKERSKKLLKKGIRVVLMKDKPREMVIGAFKNSNLFCFSSQKESFGLVFLEASASELPWISTNVGISQEIKGGFVLPAPKDKNDSTIFDLRTIEAFASKTTELLSSNIVDSGRKLVEEKYQWKNLAPKYDELLL